MGVRLRDEAVLLEPDVSADRETEEQVPDWGKSPASATPTRFQAQPLTSTEEVLTADTVIARWRAFLPPTFAGIVTPAWRVRWDDEDYEIDGDIEKHKRGTSVRYISVTLKKVT